MLWPSISPLEGAEREDVEGGGEKRVVCEGGDGGD